MFLLFALILYWGTFLTLYRGLSLNDHEERQLRMLQIWARFQAGGIGLLQLEAEASRMGLGEQPYAFRVADSRNRTVLLRYPEHWAVFDFDSLENAPRGQGLLVLSSQDRGYDLEFALLPLSQEYTLQVGTSTEHRERLLKVYRKNFLLIVAFLVPVCIGLGILLASRSVRVLKQVNLAVDRIIDTGDMSGRIPTRGTGDELDELAMRFNRMLDRIETLIAGMKGTLDTVAHDLRTPLARFRGNAERALKGGDDAESLESALASGMEESDHILRLLNTLMDITAAETGVMHLDSQPLRLRRLAEEVIDVYSYAAEEHDVALELSAGEDPTVTGDPVRLRQAVGNLVDNAVKYSPAGSTVTVSLAIDREESNGVLRVRDRGPGITGDDLPHIWDRLYRGSGGAKNPGLGLGLSLVKAIVEAHEGTVEVTDSSPAGTEITMLLPLSSITKM